ncbi:hypothetical protein [Aeromicrobium sp. UC242_57]|uniref:hypothetical protein n=1 Tax=Aeromicrobium sp. UC242_57 TaxID=3374624 RepID=UPI00379DF96A
MTRLTMFIRDLIDGYEPALARSIAVAVFVLLAAFGIGTGDLPKQVDALLIFLTFIVPIVGGWLTRRKVMPVKSAAELLPDNPYPDDEPATADQDFNPCDACDRPATHTSAGGGRWCDDHGHNVFSVGN